MVKVSEKSMCKTCKHDLLHVVFRKRVEYLPAYSLGGQFAADNAQRKCPTLLARLWRFSESRLCGYDHQVVVSARSSVLGQKREGWGTSSLVMRHNIVSQQHLPLPWYPRCNSAFVVQANWSAIHLQSLVFYMHGETKLAMVHWNTGLNLNMKVSLALHGKCVWVASQTFDCHVARQ